jgi:hypothetical protein
MMLRWPFVALALAACTPDAPPPPDQPGDEWDQKLDNRVVDYNAALRIAALRLTGELPTLTEMAAVATAGDPKTAYETQVHTYLASPKFTRQMFHYWQDTLKLGDDPEFDSAAAFAAEVTVNNRPFTDVFTATTGTCPTIDLTTFQITPADCANGVPVHAGLLTHPGMNRSFVSNFGFRRVRWVQETFACTAFPAEISTVGQDVGGVTPYTGMFPFDSLPSTPDHGGTGRVNFEDVSAVICANCHTNINHIAPLFGHFDPNGQYQATIVATTPLPNNPVAVMSDYLAPGQGLAWRHDVPITDFPSLGQAIAADPVASSCVISRLWNWALGKADIIDGGFRVPAETVDAQVQSFTAGGMHLKDAIFNIFTSDDFVRF